MSLHLSRTQLNSKISKPLQGHRDLKQDRGKTTVQPLESGEAMEATSPPTTLSRAAVGMLGWTGLAAGPEELPGVVTHTPALCASLTVSSSR